MIQKSREKRKVLFHCYYSLSPVLSPSLHLPHNPPPPPSVMVDAHLTSTVPPLTDTQLFALLKN